jgi:hypothetical protein
MYVFGWHYSQSSRNFRGVCNITKGDLSLSCLFLLSSFFRIENSAPSRRTFMKFYVWGFFFQKSDDKIQAGLKSDKNNR